MGTILGTSVGEVRISTEPPRNSCAYHNRYLSKLSFGAVAAQSLSIKASHAKPMTRSFFQLIRISVQAGRSTQVFGSAPGEVSGFWNFRTLSDNLPVVDPDTLQIVIQMRRWRGRVLDDQQQTVTTTTRETSGTEAVPGGRRQNR